MIPTHLADERLQDATQNRVVLPDLIKHLLGGLEGRDLGRRLQRRQRGARLHNRRACAWQAVAIECVCVRGESVCGV